MLRKIKDQSLNNSVRHGIFGAFITRLRKTVCLNLNRYWDNLKISKFVFFSGIFCKTVLGLVVYSQKSVPGPCTEQAC